MTRNGNFFFEVLLLSTSFSRQAHVESFRVDALHFPLTIGMGFGPQLSLALCFSITRYTISNLSFIHLILTYSWLIEHPSLLACVITYVHFSCHYFFFFLYVFYLSVIMHFPMSNP